MKKKRKLSIEQLKSRKNIAGNIEYCSYYILISVMVIFVVLSILVNIIAALMLFPALFFGAAIICVFLFLIGQLSEYYRFKLKKCIDDTIIEKLSIKGNIKDSVTLKDKNIENSILGDNIESISFKEIKAGLVIPKNANCIIEIRLPNGNYVTDFFNMSSLIKSLPASTKNKLLNDIITYIKIEPEDDNFFTLSIIGGEDFSYKEQSIPNQEINSYFQI